MRAVRFDTEWGPGWVGFEEERLMKIVLPGGRPPASETAPAASASGLAAALESYFAGDAPLPLWTAEPVGATEFRRRVYDIVQSIPPGETRTYSQVAAAVGRPEAARAVGAAMAGNPIPPLIPCHRVVGRDGSLRGYAGGLGMKADLLRREGAIP